MRITVFSFDWHFVTPCVPSGISSSHNRVPEALSSIRTFLASPDIALPARAELVIAGFG